MSNHQKPTFYIIGVPKAGTSSLYQYLKEHPDIFMSANKEPNFFLPELDGLDQISNQQAYHALFQEAGKNQERGEASVGYFSYYSHVIPEIKKQTPHAKIIVILRDPVERFMSQVRHSKRMGRETRSLQEVFKELVTEYESISEPPHRIPDQKMSETRNLRYFWFSRYYDPMKAFINHFGRDKIKILLFQRFADHTDHAMNELLTFLQVDSHIQLDTDRVYNKGGKEIIPGVDYCLKRPSLLKQVWQTIFPATLRERVSGFISRVNKTKSVLNVRTDANRLSEDQKKRMRSFFAPDIEKLQQLIAQDVSHWL